MAGEAMLKKTEKIKQGPKMLNFESSKPRVGGGADSVLPSDSTPLDFPDRFPTPCFIEPRKDPIIRILINLPLHVDEIEIG